MKTRVAKKPVRTKRSNPNGENPWNILSARHWLFGPKVLSELRILMHLAR